MELLISVFMSIIIFIASGFNPYVLFAFIFGIATNHYWKELTKPKKPVGVIEIKASVKESDIRKLK